jgi:hypothetical protein
MEQQELLSDSSDSIESPQSMNASYSDSLKLPRQRNIWQDWPWILITIAAYFSFWFIAYPTQIPDTPQIPKLNGILMHSNLTRNCNYFFCNNGWIGRNLVLFHAEICKSNSRIAKF